MNWPKALQLRLAINARETPEPRPNKTFFELLPSGGYYELNKIVTNTVLMPGKSLSC